ncbi:MAG: serine hydrolase [Gammaproteobacteria bacterium]|nr:serine hydrolase [Gammaproteobacteria bacterium]
MPGPNPALSSRPVRLRWLACCIGLGLTTLAGATISAPLETAARTAQTAADLPAQFADFDAYVESVRKTFEVPGIAVAVVKDGEIVFERGYGDRMLVEGAPGKAPVDAHTLFAIASNTKAFTATALNLLAEEGKLKLDDRVIDHLPWFQMSDPYITREMRVRDLLAHRSGLGLGAGDLLYWPTTTYTGEEVARRLRHVPLSGSFRDRYAYDNILYGVAQLVVEEVDGQPFEAFLRTRIFAPLGMDETRYNSDALKPGDRNVATGYALADFKDLQPAPRLTWHNVSGAGGVYASAHDMAKWMRLQLAGGVYRDARGAEQRMFTEKTQQQMWTAITPIPVAQPSVPELLPAKPNFVAYGQGWMLSDYRGRKLVWHTGGWPGMVSRLTLVPEHKLGVVVLTNAELGGAFNAVTLRVLDAFLDAPKTDWNAAYGAALAKSRKNADDSWAKHEAARARDSQPSLPPTGYAGTYRDPWYGDVSIAREGDALRMKFSRTPSLTGTLSHWQHDTFIVRWDERWLNADAFVTFALDADGKVREAGMQAISPNTDFSFDFHDLVLKPIVEQK